MTTHIAWRWPTARVVVLLLAHMDAVQARRVADICDTVGVHKGCHTSALAALSRAGVVVTCRNRGTRLAKPASEIALTDVFSAIEGVQIKRHNGRHWTDTSFAAIDAAVMQAMAGMTLADVQRAMAAGA